MIKKPNFFFVRLGSLVAFSIALCVLFTGISVDREEKVAVEASGKIIRQNSIAINRTDMLSFRKTSESTCTTTTIETTAEETQAETQIVINPVIETERLEIIPPVDNTPPQAQTNDLGEYSHYISGMPGIYQNPELPTGCEATALTSLLNFWGMPVDKVSIAMQYMPRADFYIENGVLHGADFYTTFAGNPSLDSGYGCYVPCLMTTADNYMNANGYSSKFEAINLTGIDLDTLLVTYIANNVPVLVITTQSLLYPYTGQTWVTPEGQRVTWQCQHHAMVIYGYDYINQTINVMDPLKSSGFAQYKLSQFKKIYQAKCQNAMIIMPEQAATTIPETVPETTHVTTTTTPNIETMIAEPAETKIETTVPEIVQSDTETVINSDSNS